MPTAAVSTDGADRQRVHLTELDAAMSAVQRRGLAQPDNTALGEAERLRLVIKRYRTQLAADAKRRRAESKEWVPDADAALALLRVMQAYAMAIQTEDRLRKIIREERKGYTDEQLDAVLVHNLRRIATRLNARQKWEFIAIMYGDRVADVLERGVRGTEAVDVG